MLIADSDLGQTTIARRGAGNMFGPGHFSVTSFPKSEEEMFGLGDEGLFGEDAMFGLGQEGPEVPQLSKPILGRKASVTLRGIGNVVAAAGGSVLAISSIGNGRSQAVNVALGALGAGLGAMAIIKLMEIFGMADLGGIY